MDIPEIDFLEGLPSDLHPAIKELKQNNTEVLTIAVIILAQMCIQGAVKTKLSECDDETLVALNLVASQIARGVVSNAQDLYCEILKGCNCQLQ